MVNSFDASGGNTCLAIEEAPARGAKTQDPRTFHVVAVSAKTSTSLLNNKRKLLDFLKRKSIAKLSDVAYTTTARRMQHALRTSYVADTTKQLISAIESDLKGPPAGLDVAAKHKANTPNIVFAFTGQGSQYVGMGRLLFQTHPIFRKTLQDYQTMLLAQGLPTDKVTFLDLIERDDLDLAGQCATKVQLAVAALEIALAGLWKSWGIVPDLVIGHSLGEYAALCAAGVLNSSDTLYLVAKRGIMMEEKLTAGTYAMLVIRQDVERVRQRLAQLKTSSCQVALKNAPEMTVVSGTQKDVELLRKHMQSQGTKTTLLQLPYGFHSAQLDPVLDEFESAAGGVTFSKPTTPVASSLLAKVVRETGTFSSKYLRNQARQAVDYIGALRSAQTEGLIHDSTLFLEIGPQPICSSFIATTLSITQARLLAGLRNGEDVWKTTSTALSAAYNAGLPVDWPEFHKHFAQSLTLLELPTYAFEETDFWTPFRWQENAIASSPAVVATPSHSDPLLHGPLHKLVSCDVSDEAASMTFECDTKQKDIREAILGHSVADTPLMPVTFMCEMGAAAAKHAFEKLYEGAQLPCMELRNVNLTSSVTVSAEGSYPLIIISARLSKGSQACTIEFESRLGGVTKQHGGCEVAFIPSNDVAVSTTSRFLPLIKSRISTLGGREANRKVHRLLKPVVYKLFQHLVTYSERYQAVDELILDTEARDAVASVTLNGFAGPANLLPAYWKDSIAHVAAVVLNCGLLVPEHQALVTSGFDNWQTFEELRGDVQYTSYVAFQEQGKESTTLGDIYILQSGRLVAAVTGLKFHMIKKTVLKTMLSSVSLQPSAPVLEEAKALETPATSLPAKIEAKRQVRIASDSVVARSSPLPPEQNLAKVDIASVFLEAIATETGLRLSELQPATEFSDIGVDSLMSITVLASLKQKTGVELMGTLFNNHDTIGSATEALKEMFPMSAQQAKKPLTRPVISQTPSFTTWPSTPASELSDVAPTITPAPASTGASTPRSEDSDPWVPVTPLSEISPLPSPPPEKQQQQPMGSVPKIRRLQGRPSDHEVPLFLFADETGAISTYIQLPQLASCVSVFAVESPFVKEPSKFDCSIEELAKLSRDAILQQHPSGRYRLGGFSGGGIVAYEVAKLLEAEGHRVETLGLIDTPMPGLDNAEKPYTVTELQDLGIISGHKRSGKFQGTVLPAQQDHIAKFLEALSKYEVKGELLGTSAAMVTAGRGLRNADASSNWITKAWSSESTQRWTRHFKEVRVLEVDAYHHDVMSFPRVRNSFYRE